MENKIKVFESKEVRTVWNAEEEEWYFSVVDVVAVLTESQDPKQYIKKMRFKRQIQRIFFVLFNPYLLLKRSRSKCGWRRSEAIASTK